MFKNVLFRWLNLTPHYDIASDGSGGGAAAGAGPASGGVPGAGSGAAAPFVMRDDALVDFGDGKPIAWRDAVGENGRYVPRDRFDRGVEYLTAEARRLEGEWDKFRRGQGPRPDQPPPNANAGPVDPMAALRGEPVISGQHLDGLVSSLYRQGLAPLAQALTKVMADNQAMKTQLQGVAQSTGSLNEERANANFEGDVTKAITDIGEIKGLGTLDPKSEPLRELTKDVYLSHEQNSWRPGELAKHVKARVESLFSTFRAAQTAEVKRAGDAKRQAFFNPTRGAATPGGEPRYVHQKGADLAAALFSGTRADAT